MFKRFEAAWTPTALFLDSDGKERRRVEGYLPKPEFAAEVGLSLGRIAFMRKQWEDAAKRYEAVLERYPLTNAAAEALYWAGVSRYRLTKDHHVLSAMGQEFTRKYQHSVWALKASVWG
jgi:TolA-binding protein